MRAALLHLSVCAAAAAAPFAIPAAAPAAGRVDAPEWPGSFEGHPLRALPPAAIDARFARDLAGAVRRFTDGEREIVVRWSAAPTRTLHPASVCYEAAGWSVEPIPLATDAAGRAWSRFRARKDAERLVVRECVEDALGRTWPEPTAWYWASLLGRTQGPATAWTVAERE